MTLVRIDASLFPEQSATREMGDLVEAQWREAHPESAVVRRDIAAEPLRFESWVQAVTAAFVPEEQRTPAQREATELARTLADELVEAEALLFTFPLYNYGVPQHVKSWFDLAYTDPRIGPGSTTLQGKPAVLVTSLGGNYDEGTPKHGWDHSTPWMRRALQDVWGLDLEIVRRSFTLVGVNPAMDRFADVAAALREQTRDQARQAGRDIAARAAVAA